MGLSGDREGNTRDERDIFLSTLRLSLVTAENHRSPGGLRAKMEYMGGASQYQASKGLDVGNQDKLQCGLVAVPSVVNVFEAAVMLACLQGQDFAQT